MPGHIRERMFRGDAEAIDADTARDVAHVRHDTSLVRMPLPGHLPQSDIKRHAFDTRRSPCTGQPLLSRHG